MKCCRLGLGGGGGGGGMRSWKEKTEGTGSMHVILFKNLIKDEKQTGTV